MVLSVYPLNESGHDGAPIYDNSNIRLNNSFKDSRIDKTNKATCTKINCHFYKALNEIIKMNRLSSSVPI